MIEEQAFFHRTYKYLQDLTVDVAITKIREYYTG